MWPGCGALADSCSSAPQGGDEPGRQAQQVERIDDRTGHHVRCAERFSGQTLGTEYRDAEPTAPQHRRIIRAVADCNHLMRAKSLDKALLMLRFWITPLQARRR